jgi:hypothetical protein
MVKDRFLIVPSFSVQPNKLVAFNSVFRRDYENELLVPIQSRSKVVRNKSNVRSENDNLKKERKSLVLSTNAKRTLRKKINWLYYLSRSRHVKSYNGKEIFNFRINFITLTLPSAQKTPTKDVTNNLLNTFLTEIRQRTKMENYVWRLEFQKNGNAHYHIVTDTYLDYYFMLGIWNRILKLNGYIDEYKSKMERLSLYGYANQYNDDGKTSFEVLRKRYLKGKATKWEQPNSVDVKSVVSKKAISFYISKYFTKEDNDKEIMNENDNEDNTKNLRLWFCSRSLSKLDTLSDFCERVDYDLFAMVEKVKDVKKIFHKYATVIYFEITKMMGEARRFIEMLLKDYSRRNGYIPVT